MNRKSMQAHQETMRFELTIPCYPELVHVVRSALAAFGARLNLTVDLIDDLKLAVTEACNNAIQHAYAGMKQPGCVRVLCWVESERIVIEVRDEGRGIAHKEMERGALERTEGELTSGTVRDEQSEDVGGERCIGLGMMIMRALMDEVDIETAPERGTTVRLIRRLVE